MGYSIAVRCENRKTKKAMFDFLEKNYRQPDRVLGFSCIDMVASQMGDKLAYDHGKNSIGFDYSSWTVSDERHYIYAVLKWVSLKVGKKKNFKGIKNVPYLVYDGIETDPCIVDTTTDKIPENYKWAVVNKFGFRTIYPSDSPWKDAEAKSLISRMANSIEKHDRLVLDELKRLDGLWASTTRQNNTR